MMTANYLEQGFIIKVLANGYSSSTATFLLPRQQRALRRDVIARTERKRRKVS